MKTPPRSLRSGAACLRAGVCGAPRLAVTGELDLNGALAQLANARYAPESSGPGGPAPATRQGAETLTVLTSLAEDRKSTRLNSSHSQISYAVFCLKNKSDGEIAVDSKEELHAVSVTVT